MTHEEMQEGEEQEEYRGPSIAAKSSDSLMPTPYHPLYYDESDLDYK